MPAVSSYDPDEGSQVDIVAEILDNERRKAGAKALRSAADAWESTQGKGNLYASWLRARAVREEVRA